MITKEQNGYYLLAALVEFSDRIVPVGGVVTSLRGRGTF